MKALHAAWRVVHDRLGAFGVVMFVLVQVPMTAVMFMFRAPLWHRGLWVTLVNVIGYRWARQFREADRRKKKTWALIERLENDDKLTSTEIAEIHAGLRDNR